jgi:hypothetical protein
MKDILGHLQRTMTLVRVEMIAEVFAIEIARRLEDMHFLHRYQRYVRKLPLPTVLSIYQEAQKKESLTRRAEYVKSACEELLGGKEAYA